MLKSLEKNCEDKLNYIFGYQLVSGLASDIIKQRLFFEENLTFIRASELARAMEAAEKNTSLVETTSSVQNVNMVMGTRSRKQKTKIATDLYKKYQRKERQRYVGKRRKTVRLVVVVVVQIIRRACTRPSEVCLF